MATREDYRRQGHDAYARGRVIIIPGTIAPRFWQRRAFIAGYTQARDEWRKKHPHADEWEAARNRSRAFCRAMIRN